MDEKRKKWLKGVLLLLAGAALLFLGAVGAFNLLEDTQPEGSYMGNEVPREMIELAYASDGTDAPVTENPLGDDLIFLPAGSATAQALPTLEAVDPSAIDVSTTPNMSAIRQTPDVDAPQPGETTEKPAVEPRWIYSAKIGLDAPIIPATSTIVEIEEKGKTYQLVQWEAPDEKSVGWHSDSAPLGVPGNTVLNGHHNVHGKVFGQLVYLQEGDLIQVYGSDGNWYAYVVAKKMVLPETGVPLQQRMENAAWLLPSTDERLTLLTCWPEQTNSHRLIIVASPVQVQVVTPTPGAGTDASAASPSSLTPTASASQTP